MNSHPIGGKSLFVSVLTNQRPRSTRGHRVPMSERLVFSSCAAVVVNASAERFYYDNYSRKYGFLVSTCLNKLVLVLIKTNERLSVGEYFLFVF